MPLAGEGDIAAVARAFGATIANRQQRPRELAGVKRSHLSVGEVVKTSSWCVQAEFMFSA